MENKEEEKFQYETNITNMEAFFKTNLYKKLEKDLKNYLDLKEEVEKNINKIVRIIKGIINQWCCKKENGEILEFYVREKVWENQGWSKNEKTLNEKIFSKEIINILEKRKHLPKGVEKIYRDPDTVDEKLYSYIKNDKECYKDILKDYKVEKNIKYHNYYFKGNNEDGNVDLSLDGIIGWKAIIDVLIKENKEISDVAKIYKVLRNPEYNGHLIWPAHGRPTINQERYSKRYSNFNATYDNLNDYVNLNDRVDYTLYDIKKYYENEKKSDNCVLKKAYEIENTKKWLNSFKNFSDFIKKMNLSHWCKEVEKDGKYEYEVMDLSQDIRKQIKNDNKEDIHPIKDYLDKSKMIEIKTKNGRYIYKYPVTKDYINNIIYIVSGGKDDKEV